MTTTTKLISELTEDEQLDLFERDEHCWAHEDWPDQGQELLNNMFVENPPDKFAFMDITTRNRIGFCWGDNFQPYDFFVDIGFILGSGQYEQHIQWAESVGLTFKDVVWLMLAEPRVNFREHHERLSICGYDLDSIDDLDDDEIEDLESQLRMMCNAPDGPQWQQYCPWFPEPEELLADYTVEQKRAAIEAWVDLVHDMRNDMAKALRDEWEHINSFEYWRDMCEANEWTTEIEVEDEQA